MFNQIYVDKTNCKMKNKFSLHISLFVFKKKQIKYKIMSLKLFTFLIRKLIFHNHK